MFGSLPVARPFSSTEVTAGAEPIDGPSSLKIKRSPTATGSLVTASPSPSVAVAVRVIKPALLIERLSS